MIRCYFQSKRKDRRLCQSVRLFVVGFEAHSAGQGNEANRVNLLLHFSRSFWHQGKWPVFRGRMYYFLFHLTRW